MPFVNTLVGALSWLTVLRRTRRQYVYSCPSEHIHDAVPSIDIQPTAPNRADMLIMSSCASSIATVLLLLDSRPQSSRVPVTEVQSGSTLHCIIGLVRGSSRSSQANCGAEAKRRDRAESTTTYDFQLTFSPSSLHSPSHSQAQTVL